MKRIQKKFKKGAASFYVVAFSTLILVIIAASFAMVIIQAVTRASNEDLSQSAYDSALGGVEDAKLAYLAYQKCLQGGNTDGLSPLPCDDIIKLFDPLEDGEDESTKCSMVGQILGKLSGSDTEVKIGSKTIDEGQNVNAINQAYTCVIINNVLNDYISTLNASNQTRVALIKFKDPGDAAKLRRVKLSWYTNSSETTKNYSNIVGNGSDARVAFQPLDKVQAAAPPTVEFQLVQTANEFSFDQVVSATVENQTDRATMYFVPTDRGDVASRSEDSSPYFSTYDGGSANVVKEQSVLDTNDPTVTNKPFVVYCNDKDPYACSVEIEMPKPIGDGTRNSNTLAFAVSLPYGQPNTDFKIELLKSGSESKLIPISMRGTQIRVDSTGRTNDLYRRVDVRLEENVAELPFLHYGLELLGDTNGDGKSLVKTMSVYPSN